MTHVDRNQVATNQVAKKIYIGTTQGIMDLKN
jgi:hypothetical protein